jgi:hypothetical protein
LRNPGAVSSFVANSTGAWNCFSAAFSAFIRSL